MVIFELKQLFLNLVDSLSGGDSTVKGFISLWVLGVFSWFFKSVPAKVLNFIKTQTLISVTLNKDSDVENIITTNNVEKWLIENNKFILRNRTINSTVDETNELIGYGNHLFFCNGRILKVFKSKESKPGVSQTIETLVLTTIGRKIDFLSNIIKQARPDQNLRYFCTINGNGWDSNKKHFFNKVAIIDKIPFLSINEDLKKQLDEALDFFVNNKDFYIKNNLPYKLTFILHGSPGTGKSSIIKYISEKLQTNLISLHPYFLTSLTLGEKFLSLKDNKKPSVICFEDFENFAASREFKKIVRKNKSKEDSSSLDDESLDVDNVSVNNDISSLLNLLQGVQPLENVILVLTTNHIDRVDEAVTRTGRIDYMIEVKALDFNAIKHYFEQVYSCSFPNHITALKPIKACDVEDIFRKNPFSPDKFIQILEQKYLE